MSNKLYSKVWIFEHFSFLGIRYKNLKGEALKIMNAKKQQIMIKFVQDIGFWIQ